ncbi:protein Wnt-2-like isoform X1 [Mytilus californianus]|uniref:protein Wnt-2-like isoform X1 n=1 Tax=Mytilus californianus TaxID=6549 RepID=UPI002245C856|nr:protein Wnt-2-like isoform X1 [Mytilus californianus]
MNGINSSWIILSIFLLARSCRSLNEILNRSTEEGLVFNTFTENVDFIDFLDQHSVNEEILHIMTNGTSIAQEECQYQFKWDTWNCPVDIAMLDRNDSTREASFVQAITAAGLMYAVTKYCRSEEQTLCSCDHTKREPSQNSGMVWGGCSDNIKFGIKFTQQLLNKMDPGNDSNAAMRRHNYKVGLRAVLWSAKLDCVCPGINNNCATMRVCWKQVSIFRDIGTFLKELYTHAQFVKYLDKQLWLEYYGGTRELILKKELAYLQMSPDSIYVPPIFKNKVMLKTYQNLVKMLRIVKLTDQHWIFDPALVLGPLIVSNNTRNAYFLTRLQVMSKKHILQGVRSGTLTAQEECQYQFNWERWNCPENKAPISQEFATREAAFVQAITAAGIIHAIAKLCSSGQETFCSCEKTQYKLDPVDNIQTFYWDGCSNNIKFGGKFTYEFLKELASGKDENAAMQLHNYEVGHKAVEKTAKTKCTCQGKGCAFKVCWRQVSTFRHIGSFLKNRYKKAKLVQFIDGQLQQRKYTPSQKVTTIKKKHLTYLQKSPNYCTKNHVLNIEGTEGRQCARNKNTTDLSERKSCKTLCTSCGYKVIRKQNKYVCLK